MNLLDDIIYRLDSTIWENHELIMSVLVGIAGFAFLLMMYCLVSSAVKGLRNRNSDSIKQETKQLTKDMINYVKYILNADNLWHRGYKSIRTNEGVEPEIYVGMGPFELQVSCDDVSDLVSWRDRVDIHRRAKKLYKRQQEQDEFNRVKQLSDLCCGGSSLGPVGPVGEPGPCCTPGQPGPCGILGLPSRFCGEWRAEIITPASKALSDEQIEEIAQAVGLAKEAEGDDASSDDLALKNTHDELDRAVPTDKPAKVVEKEDLNEVYTKLMARFKELKKEKEEKEVKAAA